MSCQEVNDYIQQFPPKQRRLLKEIRAAIRQVVPDTTQEKISYGIPTFHLKKNIIHYAGYTNHLGMYPIPKGDEAFQTAVEPYVKGKGTLHFSLEEELPVKLIKAVVLWRMKELNISAFATNEFSFLSAPAQRALENAKIKNLKTLSSYTYEEIAALHGIGASALRALEVKMEEQQLKFK
ncbi:DUF1801 domain-containing protein [Gynurincola endophyticus]|jgi:uncharacterized protein YdhG (YjbR/CyaY superfamily)|uniref:DUF1801 domain-containing protein n=1 Tax=Gynurincola endophyticus TaxID=2479004 RepID=UPI000F8CCA57|nr:DUF1801 domain-containing protein [Gynurincola endophyticus]